MGLLSAHLWIIEDIIFWRSRKIKKKTIAVWAIRVCL